MNKAIIIISYSILFAQITVMPQGRDLIQNALLMERKGDIERARTLYEDMLRENPGNRQAYQRLKEILKRTGELESAAQLVEVWIDLNPNDLQAYIELGEIVFLKEDKIRAAKIWHDFETAYGTNISIYRMLVHTFSRLGLTEEMEARTYTFKRWLDDTGSTFDEAGDSIINGISSAGSSNHMYLAHNVGFFEDDDGDGALIGIVDPCFDSSNIVQIGVNNAKTGSALLVAVSSPLERDGGNGCGSGSVVLQQEGSSALGNVLVDAAKEPKTYNTTEEYISVFPFSDDQYTINVAITDQDPLSSEVATAKSATFSVDSGVLKIPRVRAYGEVFEATLNQQNKQARSTNEEALKFVLSELGELSIDEVVDAYRATFNEEKQQVVIPRVTVSETDEAFSVILQYYPAENGNDAWFEVADFKLIE